MPSVFSGIYVIYLVFVVLLDLHIFNTSTATLSEMDKCVFSNVVGRCRRIQECPRLWYLLVRSKSRPSPKVLRYLREIHCGFMGKDPLICCQYSDSPQRNSHMKSSEKHNFLTVNASMSAEYLLPSSCGIINIRDKIVGGTEAGLEEFPWMALIGYSTAKGVQYRCGGTLINWRYVLTAAHCVRNLKGFRLKTVRLGEYDLLTEIDCSTTQGCSPPVQEIAIKRVVPHPNFHEKELRNDIALIELSENANFTSSVRPICLPINPRQRELNLDDDAMVMVGGWGATEHGAYSRVLRVAEIRLTRSEECREIYRRIIPIHDTQICAGGEGGIDSCNGDSGGPLMITVENDHNDSVYMQYGVVSFGPRKCGTPDKPGVYTWVPSYMDWIMKVIT